MGRVCSLWAMPVAGRLTWIAWPGCPSFDIFPMTSIETKRRLRDEAMQRGTLLVFQHDPQVVTGRLIPGARGPQVRSEITEEPWFDASR